MLLVVAAGSIALLASLPHAGASGTWKATPASTSGVPVHGRPVVIRRPSRAPGRARDPAELGVSITPDPALLEGADGGVTVALSRVSADDFAVRRAALGIALPRSAGVKTVSGLGWICTTSRHRRRVACRLKATSTSTRALTPLHLGLDLRAGGPTGRMRVRGTWVQPAAGGRKVSRAATDALRLRPALPLKVTASAVDGTVGDAITGLRAPQVVLRGTIKRRGEEPIHYRWRQLCPNRCVHVHWSTPTADMLAPGQVPDAAFQTPQVSRTTTLRFVLEARDARGLVRDTAQVRVLPQSIERLAPRLSKTALAGRELKADERPGRPFRLIAADRAAVDVGGRGPTRVRPGGLVHLVGDVRGQRENRVRWREISGPPFLLAHARHVGNRLSFRAPGTSGTAIVRMTAWTKDGRFTRDELIEVIDTGAAAAAAAVPRGARVASAESEAFCRLVHAARQGTGEFTIPLASGGVLKADAAHPAGTGCSGDETVRFAAGSVKLGDFRLEGLRGTVTRDRGLVVEAGRLALPDFWNGNAISASKHGVAGGRALTGRATAAAVHSAAEGPSIGFSLPTGESSAARVGVRLGSGGWGDLTGDLALDSNSLAKLPLAESLPGGWRMTELRLGVNPEAEQFELSATARGPATTSKDSALELDGALTFDGQVFVQVDAANLAVLGSREHQTTVSATGQLTLLPGRRYDANGNPEGGIVPVVDIAVSGAIEGYEPADGLTLSGSVSWATNGPLEIDGTLDAKAKGTDVRLSVAGSFTSTEDWELRGELQSDSGVRLGDVLTVKNLQGTLSRSGGELRLSFTGDATDIAQIHGVKARDARATLSTSDCAVAAEPEPTNPPRVCLSINTTLEVTLPGASRPLEFTGGLALELTTLTFRVTGGLPSNESFGPKALRLHDVTIWATNAQPAQAACADAAAASRARAAASGVSFGFRAKGEVAGLALNDIRGAYLANNSYCLGADIGAAQLKDDGTLARPGSNPASGCGAPNAPALQGLKFTYASATEKSSLDGRFCLPQKLRGDLGRLGEGTGTVHLELTTAPGSTALSGDVNYTLGNPYWLIGAKDATGTAPDDTKAALAFRSFGFTLNINSAGVEIGLNAGATLRLPKPSTNLGGDAATAQASETPLTIGALAHLGANPSFTLVVQLGGAAKGPCTPQSEGALHDVFGQKGLTVCHLGVSGELSASPSLSVSASFTLPDAWSKQLGSSNAALRVGFSLSAARPCVDLAIEQADRNRPAMDLFDKGVVITNQAHLLVAPTGCQLPRAEGLKTIEPGFRLDFDGAVLGAKVAVFAEIKRSGAAFAVNAGFKSDELELGALKFGKTDIRVKAEPTAGTTSISVETSAQLGTGELAKASFHLNAAFTVSGSGASREISLTGNSGVEFSLAGAKYKGTLTLNFSLQRGEPKGSFSGGLEADLKIFKYGVTVHTLVYDRGVQALDVSVHGTAAFGVGELSASGRFTYAKNPGKTHINLGGTFTIWNVYSNKVTLDMDLGPLRLGFSFGPKEGALRIPSGPLTVVRVAGLNQGGVDAKPDGPTTTDLTREVEVDSCDKFELFCLEVHSVKLNRQTGVLEGKVLNVFPVSVSASELVTKKSAPPPEYVKRFGNLVSEAPGGWAPAISLGRCLEVPKGQFNNGQGIGTYPCIGSPHERWSLTPQGLFHAAQKPEKCLDATPRGLVRPELFTCTPDAQWQGWHFDDRGRLHNGYQDRCLTAVPTDNPSGETRMDTCNDSKEQRWALSGRIRPLGVRDIHLGGSNCLALDTDKPAPEPGRELQQRWCINETEQAVNQYFAFTPSGTLQVSGLCVDVVPSTGNGHGHPTPKAETCDGSKRQRWELTKYGQFRNPVTRLCLVGNDESARPGQPRRVDLLVCGGHERFQWDFGA